MKTENTRVARLPKEQYQQAVGLALKYDTSVSTIIHAGLLLLSNQLREKNREIANGTAHVLRVLIEQHRHYPRTKKQKQTLLKGVL